MAVIPLDAFGSVRIPQQPHADRTENGWGTFSETKILQSIFAFSFVSFQKFVFLGYWPSAAGSIRPSWWSQVLLVRGEGQAHSCFCHSQKHEDVVRRASYLLRRHVQDRPQLVQAAVHVSGFQGMLLRRYHFTHFHMKHFSGTQTCATCFRSHEEEENVSLLCGSSTVEIVGS